MRNNYSCSVVLFLVALMVLIGSAQGMDAGGGKALSRDEAYTLVFSDVLKGNTDGIWVFAAPEPVAAGTSIDTWYGTVVLPEGEGWLFFIDDMPMENWAHPCRYVHVDMTGVVTVKSAYGPPEDLAKWDKVGGSSPPVEQLSGGSSLPLQRMTNVQNVQNGLPACTDSRHCYAVLISGGADSWNNWPRYYGDIQFMYKTLVYDYGYQDDHIYVLMSDGTDPGLDMHTQTDPDPKQPPFIPELYESSKPDLDGDGDDDVGYSATKANIATVFDILHNDLGAGDHLFIFTTDHGGPDGDVNPRGSNVVMNLWGEVIKDDEFATEVDKVSSAVPIIITMEQCYSGGFVDDIIPGLSGQERVIATAANDSEFSYADTFSTLWISAVAGHDKSGSTVNADADNNGKVSMQEAFNYAKNNDPEAEHPQYGESPSGIGSSLALCSCYVPTLPIAAAGPDQTVEQVALAGTSVTLDGSGSSDPCGKGLTYAWTWSGGSSSDIKPTATFPLGTTIVTLRVTADGRTSEPDTVSIKVIDTTPPVLGSIPVDKIVEQTSKDGTPVTFGTPTATDICDANVEITNDAPSVFPLGITTVKFTATDDSGNLASASMKVTVVDTTPPLLVAPADKVVEQTNAAGTPVTLTPTATDICDANVEITSDAPSVFPLGVTTVKFKATDDSGNSASASMKVTVKDTTPPVLTVPADVTVEQATRAGTVVPLTATATDICDAAPVVTGNAPAIFPLGDTTVTFTATDASGNKATKTMKVHVVDTTPPVISVTLTPNTMWSPNHKMVNIRATVTATDICDAAPVKTLTKITSNEPDDAPGIGDGSTINDIDAAIGKSVYTFKLRAERSGEGHGRVYVVTYTATDKSGNSASASATVVVPLEK